MGQAWHTPLSVEEASLHLLNRITFGLRHDDIERVRRVGVEAFLDEQLHPERLDDSQLELRLRALPSLEMTSAELVESFPPPRLARRAAPEQSPRTASVTPRAEQGMMEPGAAMQRDAEQTQTMQSPRESPSAMERSGLPAISGPREVLVELAREELWRAVYSRRQLQEVMVQFWMNHFNIFAGKGADRWLLTSFERDAIRPHALGGFEDLLVATAQSAAMLFYLDNWLSSAPNPNDAGRFAKPAPNMDRAAWHPFAGFGRRGLSGRRPFPPNPRPANAPRQKARRGLNENYARELMELHTLGVDGGFTLRDVIEVARCFTGWTIDRPRRGDFMFNPSLHDFGEKVVLGQKIKAGRGMEDGLEVLHLLAHHPSTARFISLELCRRLVADDPPPSVVAHACNTFLKTGGEVCAVLKAILTSPEFNSQAAFRAKLKSPFELVASSLRALNANTDAGVPVLMAMARMGQPMFLYQAPSGYPDRASTWINSSSLLARVNFAALLAFNHLRGTQVDLAEITAKAGTPETAFDALAERLLGGSAPAETSQAILREVSANPLPSVPADRQITQMAALLLASPEFQRR